MALCVALVVALSYRGAFGAASERFRHVMWGGGVATWRRRGGGVAAAWRRRGGVIAASQRRRPSKFGPGPNSKRPYSITFAALACVRRPLEGPTEKTSARAPRDGSRSASLRSSSSMGAMRPDMVPRCGVAATAAASPRLLRRRRDRVARRNGSPARLGAASARATTRARRFGLAVTGAAARWMRAASTAQRRRLLIPPLAEPPQDEL